MPTFWRKVTTDERAKQWQMFVTCGLGEKTTIVSCPDGRQK